MAQVILPPTVEEVLSLPCFAGAEVVAGRDSLDRPVLWSHVSELLDIGRLLSGGELLLSTGMALSRVPADDQRWYLRTLAAAEVAGLVLELVQFLRLLEEDFLAEANDLHLPIIVFHSEVRFAGIMRAIHARILLPHAIRPVGGGSDLLDALEETGRLEGYVHAELAPLLSLPPRPRRTLLTTLRTLLVAGFNVAEAARCLQVRRQTIYYRLEQLEGLIGPDLHSSGRWVPLFVAVHGYDRLSAQAGPELRQVAPLR